jgi:nuclease HARBI1
VERTFGIWKRKFPCLTRGLGLKIETTVAVICATAVLHNIAIRQNDVGEHYDEVEIEGRNNLQNIPNMDEENGLQFRRQFVQQYFTN